MHDYELDETVFCISVMHPVLGVHTCMCTCTHLMWHFVRSLLPPHLSLPLPSVPGALLKIHVRGESPHAIVCEKGVDFQCIIIHLTSKPTLVTWLTNLSHAIILLFVIKISPALLRSQTLLIAKSDSSHFKVRQLTLQTRQFTLQTQTVHIANHQSASGDKWRVS